MSDSDFTTKAAQSAAEQAGQVFARRASGMTRVVSPWTALAYSFVAPNITQASFYLLWAVTLYAGAQMQISILFMLTLIPLPPSTPTSLLPCPDPAVSISISAVY